MTYLHEECHDCILHCNIKPENTLLDDNYCVRISVGLARLINLNDHMYRSLMIVRGTRGYGMVLLEIVSGRKNFEVSSEISNNKFSLWVYEEFEKGNVGAILDPRLMEDDIDMVQAMRLVQASFWCIQQQSLIRPTMGNVVQMIEGICDVDKPPPPLGMIHSSAVISSSHMGIVSYETSID
ncbi:hypothetical protein ACS0TY_028204 [Phlomoides rotata]